MWTSVWMGLRLVETCLSECGHGHGHVNENSHKGGLSHLLQGWPEPFTYTPCMTVLLVISLPKIP